jgi:hypothetical protein
MRRSVYFSSRFASVAQRDSVVAQVATMTFVQFHTWFYRHKHPDDDANTC